MSNPVSELFNLWSSIKVATGSTVAETSELSILAYYTRDTMHMETIMKHLRGAGELTKELKEGTYFGKMGMLIRAAAIDMAMVELPPLSSVPTAAPYGMNKDGEHLDKDGNAAEGGNAKAVRYMVRLQWNDGHSALKLKNMLDSLGGMI